MQLEGASSELSNVTKYYRIKGP